jgi:PKD repeat protein
MDPGSAIHSFHFVLNNYVKSDTRIPGYGMSYDEAKRRNALPVPETQYGDPGPGGEYNYWDELALNVPAGAETATIRLMYQPTSWEYVQFLYLANEAPTPNLQDVGKDFLDAWYNTGMAEPHVMATTTWVNNGSVPTNNPPTAEFSSLCADLSCSFDASASSDSDGSIVSYSWDFGDGGTATGINPSHTYGADGTYLVTLTVTDDGGASSSTSQSLTLTSATPTNEPPVADFSFTCTELDCSFDGSGSIDLDGSITSYVWDFGDGSTGTGMTTTHLYAADGSYTVTLTVTDDAGATASVSQTVSVAAAVTDLAPVANFSFACTDLTCDFDGSLSTDDGSITAYDWQLGDGATATGVTTTHTYAATGTYSVTLTVTDDAGLSGSATQDVSVTAPAAIPGPGPGPRRGR